MPKYEFIIYDTANGEDIGRIDTVEHPTQEEALEDACEAILFVGMRVFEVEEKRRREVAIVIEVAGRGRVSSNDVQEWEEVE